jgi:hypothetical protein
MWPAALKLQASIPSPVRRVRGFGQKEQENSADASRRYSASAAQGNNLAPR